MMQLFWTAFKTLQPRSLKSAVFYTILFVAVTLYIATQSVSTEPRDNTGSSQRSVRSNLQSPHLKVKGRQSADRSSNKTRLQQLEGGSRQEVRKGEGKGSEGLEHNDVRSVRDGKQNKETKIDPVVPIGHVDDHLNQNQVQKEKQLQSALNTNHVESEEAHSLRKDTFGQEPDNPGLPEAGMANEVREGVLNNGGGLQSDGDGGTQPLAQSESKATLNEAKQGAPATAEKAANKVAGHDEGLGLNGNVVGDKPKVQVGNPAGGSVNTDKKESNQKEVVVDKAVALTNMKQVAIATATTTTTHASDVINPHDFGYLINNETLCRSAAGPIHHIIYFHSNPQTIKVRARLRRSWAQDNLFANFTSRRVFFMGRPSNEKLLANIRAEGHKYGDIVMEDYHDSYNNLTLKAIGAMKWIDRFCRNARFLVKADEDVYVNIFKVIEDLTGWFANQRRFFLCRVYSSGTMPILRRPQDCAKWCVPDNVFPGEKSYPTYCAGATYVLSADITRDLYAISLRTPYFYIDDAYLTGILVKKLGSIQHYDMGAQSLRISSKNIEHTMFEANATRIVYGIHDERMTSGYYWKNHLQRLSKEQIALIGEDKYNTLIREFNVTQTDNESMR